MTEKSGEEEDRTDEVRNEEIQIDKQSVELINRERERESKRQREIQRGRKTQKEREKERGQTECKGRYFR